MLLKTFSTGSLSSLLPLLPHQVSLQVVARGWTIVDYLLGDWTRTLTLTNAPLLLPAPPIITTITTLTTVTTHTRGTMYTRFTITTTARFTMQWTSKWRDTMTTTRTLHSEGNNY